MMKKLSKKILSVLLCMAMIAAVIPAGVFSVFAEDTNVAQIGNTTYSSLSEAITAANAMESGATITLLSDITLSEKLTISKNITISGEHTITRGIEGTIFAVDKNATLTLDGGVVIDGGNKWTFDSENFYADLAAAKTLDTGAKESYSTSEEGGLVATAQMITISGTSGAVVMNKATIKNIWSKNHNTAAIFSVPAGATLTINDGALISHIRGSVVGQIKGSWTMHGGKITGVHGHNTNGCLSDIRGGGIVINGGEICNNTLLGLNANGSGVISQVYGESSKLTINGGYIHHNATFSPGTGLGAVVYLNGGGDFEMNGGTIETNASDNCTAFVTSSTISTSILLNKGTLVTDENTGTRLFDSRVCGKVFVGEEMTINGKGLTLICGNPGDEFENKGTINSDIQISHPHIKGEGTYNGDVLVKVESYISLGDGIIISGGIWNGDVTVTPGASLNVSGGEWHGDITVEEGATLVIEDGELNGAITVKDGANVSFGENFKDTYHSVTFDCGNGEKLTSYVKDNQTVAKPDVTPEIDGVVYSGWYYEGEEFDFDTEIEKDITVKARWISSITFDTDGGSDIDDITQDYGSAITAPEAPVKEGYTFAGWDKEVPTTMPVEGLTIKALWTVNQYTVTFDTDGGNVIAPITQDYGTVISAPEAPTKAGYVFDNWYVEGALVELEGYKLVGDITVEARYNVDKNNNGIADIAEPAYTDSFDDMFQRLINAFGSLVTIVLMSIFMPVFLVALLG